MAQGLHNPGLGNALVKGHVAQHGIAKVVQIHDLTNEGIAIRYRNETNSRKKGSFFRWLEIKHPRAA